MPDYLSGGTEPLRPSDKVVEESRTGRESTDLLEQRRGRQEKDHALKFIRNVKAHGGRELNHPSPCDQES
ncbi:unnamed protein product [Arctogadus glacialis]